MYFFEQFGSGHSRRTGEVAGGGLPLPPLLVLLTTVVGAAGEGGGGGGRVVVLAAGGVGAPGAGFDFFPLTGGCWDSSSDLFFRFVPESGLGGTKGVGDEVLSPRRPLLDLLFPPLLLVELLLRNLLCTDDRVSVKLLKSFPELELLEPLPRLPLPLGVRASKSLVGESQNLQQ